jgi:hydroxymethylbilane synthase
VQAERVAKALRKLHPVEVEFHWVTSAGDQITEGSLAEAGGKGLFTSSVDQAVLDGKADVAVHSLKDLPVDPAEALPGMKLAAVPKRAAVHDCLVSARAYGSIEQLPDAAVVGTSSPRRAAQLRARRPDLDVRLLRGNVDTRLQKVLDGGTYDAAVLAVAGLKRLGLTEHIRQPLDPEVMLPAAAQGAIGLRCRATDHVTLTRCLPLNAAASSTAVTHERELVRRLGADCYSPIAVLAEPIDPAQTQAKRNADSHWFRLRARVCSADGRTVLRFDEKCKTREMRRLVKHAAERLVEQGARELLAEAIDHRIPERLNGHAHPASLPPLPRRAPLRGPQVLAE